MNSDFEEERLKDLIADLDKDGFEAYVTSVGGERFGHPFAVRSGLHGFAPATPPPDTPNGGDENEDEEASAPFKPLRSSFERLSTG